MKPFGNLGQAVSRDTFITLFLILVLLLMFFPLMATFNDILTRIVVNLQGYWFIREVIVPFEVRMVAVVLAAMGFDVTVTREYVVLGQTYPFIAEIIWNCIGWQSLVLLGLTFITGLSGNFTRFSKLQVVLIGVLGTFLINILRMISITALMYFWNEVAVRIMHDYVAVLVALLWMVFFWWFVYSFVLEEKSGENFGT